MDYTIKALALEELITEIETDCCEFEEDETLTEKQIEYEQRRYTICLNILRKKLEFYEKKSN